MINNLLDTYSIILLEKSPGYIDYWFGEQNEISLKYELGRSFKKHNIHGFFIVNMESKLYVTFTGLFTFFILSLVVFSYKKI